jgi:hypothetical protein
MNSEHHARGTLAAPAMPGCFDHGCAAPILAANPSALGVREEVARAVLELRWILLNRDASVAVIEGAKDANTPATTEIRGDFTRSRSLVGRRRVGYPCRLPEYVDLVPRTSAERPLCLGAPHTRA